MERVIVGPIMFCSIRVINLVFSIIIYYKYLCFSDQVGKNHVFDSVYIQESLRKFMKIDRYFGKEIR